LSYTPVCAARAARPLHAATRPWMQGPSAPACARRCEGRDAVRGSEPFRDAPGRGGSLDRFGTPRTAERVESAEKKRPARSRPFPSPVTGDQSLMAATTPAPTVRPPSRMAKRSFSSMATGTISTTSMVTLSPGITISVPSGSVTTPVTSVVRK